LFGLKVSGGDGRDESSGARSSGRLNQVLVWSTSVWQSPKSYRQIGLFAVGEIETKKKCKAGNFSGSFSFRCFSEDFSLPNAADEGTTQLASS
jgi:hypothetical protein